MDKLPEVLDDSGRSLLLKQTFGFCRTIIDNTNNNYRLIKQAIHAISHIGFVSKKWRARSISVLVSVFKNESYRSNPRRHAIRCLGTLSTNDKEVAFMLLKVFIPLLRRKKERSQYVRKAACTGLSRIGRAFPEYQPIILYVFDSIFEPDGRKGSHLQETMMWGLLIGYGRLAQTNPEIIEKYFPHWEAALKAKHYRVRWAGIKGMGHAVSFATNKKLKKKCYRAAVKIIRSGPAEGDEIMVQYAAVQSLGLILRSDPSKWWKKTKSIFVDILNDSEYPSIVKSSVFITLGRLSFYVDYKSEIFRVIWDILTAWAESKDKNISESAIFAMANVAVSHKNKVKRVYKTFYGIFEGRPLNEQSEENLLLFLRPWAMLMAGVYEPVFKRVEKILMASPKVPKGLDSTGVDIINALYYEDHVLRKPRKKKKRRNKKPKEESLEELIQKFLERTEITSLERIDNPPSQSLILSVLSSKSIGVLRTLRILVRSPEKILGNGAIVEHLAKEIPIESSPTKETLKIVSEFLNGKVDPKILNFVLLLLEHPNRILSSSKNVKLLYKILTKILDGNKDEKANQSESSEWSDDESAPAFVKPKPPVVKKTKICQDFLAGKCDKGEDCEFIHDPSQIPCKYYHSKVGCARGDGCPFKHGPLTDEEWKLIEKEVQRLNKNYDERQAKKSDKEEQEEAPTYQQAVNAPYLIQPQYFSGVPYVVNAAVGGYMAPYAPTAVYTGYFAYPPQVVPQGYYMQPVVAFAGQNPVAVQAGMYENHASGAPTEPHEQSAPVTTEVSRGQAHGQSLSVSRNVFPARKPNDNTSESSSSDEEDGDDFSSYYDILKDFEENKGNGYARPRSND